MARISSWTSFAAAITSGSSGVCLAAPVLVARRDSAETAGAADLALARLLRVAMAARVLYTGLVFPGTAPS